MMNKFFSSTVGFLGRPDIDGVCEPIPPLTPVVIEFLVTTGVGVSSYKSI